MDSPQEEPIDDVLVDVVYVTENKSGINTQVYDQHNPCHNLHPSDEA